MNRWIVVLALAACGTPQAEIDKCETAPACLEEDPVAYGEVCDVLCVNVTECCDCLADFGCLEVGADRCVSNVSDGGLIAVAANCESDPARCGTACDGVLSAR